jgi:hypothetical protein
VPLELCAALIGAAPLAAQSVTSAAIQGRVLNADSLPIDGAILLTINTSNGERWQTTTNAGGHYFVDYLSVGGPYRIEVRALGFEPARRDSIFLALGQRLTSDFVLLTAALQLEEIAVTGIADPRLNAARTGPAQIVSGTTIARVPVNRRDYAELALLSPQVTRSPNGGLSLAGQHDRLNGFQIDGANNNDLFGCSCSGNGTPGFNVNLTAFTPEAVKELQVLTAPFDVRYGNFAGALVNAVTRSGSNQFEGSLVGYLESVGLSGRDTTGSRGDDFNRKEFSLTFGAPIVRDRVALFVNAALRHQVFPQEIPAPTSDTTGGADSAGVGIRYESLTRFQGILRSRGVDPGTFSRGAFRAPTRNLFAKVTAQLGVNSRLEVSHNYGHGNLQDEIGLRFHGLYTLSSGGSENPEAINATRLAWTTAFGSRFSNELILARLHDRRTCRPNSDFSEVAVAADGGAILAGTAGLCGGVETGQTIWEVTDNFGVAAGNHRLTLGTHGELIDLVDNAVLRSAGRWFFDSLDSLAQGVSSFYQRDLPGPQGRQVGFTVRQIGLYAQDQWTPTPRLTLTAGLRVDFPFIPNAPPQHPTLLSELGINTALTPSGNPLWAPRLGANYDISGRGVTYLRGGLGLFAGRPAYLWFRNVYATTGVLAVTVLCQGDAVPAFILDPAQQPSTCAEPTPQLPPVNYFDPAFRFPRYVKLALGVDHLLPGGIVGTVDLLYTRGVNAFHVVDVNLAGPTGVAAGEGGRAIYGTIDPATGRATPTRLAPTIAGGVYEIRNGSRDRSYVVTAQLQKRFAGDTEVSAAYTYTDARDLMSPAGDFAQTNVNTTPVDGTLEQRNLRTSLWTRPHKVTVVGTANLPLGIRAGLIYTGSSGTPLTYVVLGDANADGFPPPAGGANDVVYVPNDAGDIALAAPAEYSELDRIIQEEPCLRAQRGRLLERNSCSNPWEHQTQLRLMRRFHLSSRPALELSADLFNVLNFLDADWGLVRQTLPGGLGFALANKIPLLRLGGYEPANGRGVYRLLPINRRQIDANASRWRFQLGVKLLFGG